MIDFLGYHLDRVDPVTGRVLATIPFESQFGTPVIAFGSAWVPRHPLVLRIDLRTGRREAEIPFFAPGSLGADTHGVWMVSVPEEGSPESDLVQLIGPHTNSPVGRGVRVSGALVGFAVGDRSVWIADFSGPTIIRVQVLPTRASK